jgi:hypothetical protein
MREAAATDEGFVAGCTLGVALTPTLAPCTSLSTAATARPPPPPPQHPRVQIRICRLAPPAPARGARRLGRCGDTLPGAGGEGCGSGGRALRGKHSRQATSFGWHQSTGEFRRLGSESITFPILCLLGRRPTLRPIRLAKQLIGPAYCCRTPRCRRCLSLLRSLRTVRRERGRKAATAAAPACSRAGTRRAEPESTTHKKL